MRRRRWSSTAVALLAAAVALALATVLAGCGPDVKAAAAKLPAIPAGLDAPVYVVIDDVTAHDNDVSEARAEAFDAVAQAAFERGAGLVLVTAGSTPESVGTVFSTVAVAEDVNAEFTKRRKATMTRAMKQRFAAADARQTGGSLDVLAALREVQSQLRSVGNGEFRVLVMSSGQLRRPIDLQAHPQFLADPEATAAELAKAARLPDLRGWDVAFLNDGDVQADRAQALAALWWHVVKAAGGRLTGYQKGLTSWPLPVMAEPRAPALVRVPAAGDKVVVSVSDSVLFDVDQAALRADAAPVIGQLAELLLTEYPKAPATITGFTDSTGSGAYNLELSRRRAEAVASALVGEGVSSTRLSVAGRGASGFVASNDTAAGRAANRRTEVALSLE